jgi:hypothetical protein
MSRRKTATSFAQLERASQTFPATDHAGGSGYPTLIALGREALCLSHAFLFTVSLRVGAPHIHGAMIVQMNVEDTRNGVAEYLIEKYGDKVILELKWGQGAKCIGGEIQVDNIEYALFVKDRERQNSFPMPVPAFLSSTLKLS